MHEWKIGKRVGGMERVITYRHNIMEINSLETFLGIRGGCNRGCRDVYFVRALGCGRDTIAKIEEIDRKMETERESHRLFYTRAARLPALPSREETAFYEEQFAAFASGKRIGVKNLSGDGVFGSALALACQDVLGKYRLIKKNVTESMEKNFAIKLLYWTDCILGSALSGWNERKCYKVLADNVVKEQEYLFYYMLTLIGCDVLLFESRGDIHTAESVRKLSMVLKLGEFCMEPFPEYKPSERREAIGTEPVSKIQPGTALKPELKQSVKPELKQSVKPELKQSAKPEARPPVKPMPQAGGQKRQDTGARSNGGEEKSFEDLALLASSIVMIEVHDRRGKPIGTGSGVMIGRDGYILTNHHVTRGGYYFSVRIEDDGREYRTNEVIKYNSVFDLSVLRIDRTLAPLPVYRGAKKLVRGQKVVAIGSPLGLFNSVSDGIISGFREIDAVDMIQFTAPISHGSSGGAVLNMQGEIIGISTAGFDGGQNINLAVGYETINLFIRGFT